MTGSTGNKGKLYGILFFNTLVVSMDYVLWIRLTTQLQPFSWFVSQLLYPISVAAILWPVVGVLHFRGLIPEGNRTFPKWIFVMLAFFGTFQNYCMAIFSGLLDGTLQAVLSKCSTVVVMIQTLAILGTRYRWTHIVAAVMMMGAAAIAAIPAMRAEPPSISNTTAEALGEERSQGDTVMGLILFCITIAIPKRVYEEKYSKNADLHPVYFRAWEILIQVGLAVGLLPLAFIRVVPTQKPPTWEGLGPYLRSAIGCLGGVEQPDYPEAQCSDTGVIWVAMIVCNVCHDVSSIAISKYGSAALGEMWSSLMLLVTVGLMQWPWLTGEPDKPITIFTVLSLVVIVFGLGLYGWHPEIPRESDPADKASIECDTEKGIPKQEGEASMRETLLPA